jgi:hypothetical protein
MYDGKEGGRIYGNKCLTIKIPAFSACTSMLYSSVGWYQCSGWTSCLHMKTKESVFSKVLVCKSIDRTIRRHIPEDCASHRRWKLKSHNVLNASMTRLKVLTD